MQLHEAQQLLTLEQLTQVNPVSASLLLAICRQGDQICSSSGGTRQLYPYDSAVLQHQMQLHEAQQLLTLEQLTQVRARLSYSCFYWVVT